MIEPALAEPLEAHEPPEVRGRDRADVALLVARRAEGALVHARFGELPRFLRAGDLLVVNTSATLPAALAARQDERAVELHLSTPAGDRNGAGDGNWVVELRTAELLPLPTPRIGARIDLPGGAHAELLAPYLGSSRLSIARLSLGEPVEDYLRRHGLPIRYRHAPAAWPIDAIRRSSRSTPAAPRCPAPGGRSRPSWWRSSRRVACSWRR
jgi:S-adenosylmethionine:tRNA ribosyltransferase-isomerase